MYGIDYRQVVSEETQSRINDLYELKEIIEYAMHCFEDLGKDVRSDYVRLAGDLEQYLAIVDDDIEQAEHDVDSELDATDVRCD